MSWFRQIFSRLSSNPALVGPATPAEPDGEYSGPERGRPEGWDDGRPERGRPEGWDDGRPERGRPEDWDDSRPERGRPGDGDDGRPEQEAPTPGIPEGHEPGGGAPKPGIPEGHEPGGGGAPKPGIPEGHEPGGGGAPKPGIPEGHEPGGGAPKPGIPEGHEPGSSEGHDVKPPPLTAPITNTEGLAPPPSPEVSATEAEPPVIPSMPLYLKRVREGVPRPDDDDGPSSLVSLTPAKAEDQVQLAPSAVDGPSADSTLDSPDVDDLDL